MPVSVNSLFPMAAGAGSAAAPAVALAGTADSLTGGLTSARQAMGSFQSLLGAAQVGAGQVGAPQVALATAASTKAAVPSGVEVPDGEQAADLVASPPPPADTLAGDKAVLPQIAAEAPVQDAAAALGKPASLGQTAKPTETAHAVAADHIKPQAPTADPILPQLVKQAASPETTSAEPASETEATDDDAATVSDEGEAPVAKHVEGDAAVVVLPALSPTSQAAPNAALAGAAAIQPQFAATPQGVHDVAAADAAKGTAEGTGKGSAKLAKAGAATMVTPFERAAQEPAASRSQGGATVTAAATDAAADQGAPSSDANLSAPLFSQTLAGTASRPGALPYTPTAPSAPQSATVSVQQGQFGNDIGVEIARALDKGGDDLLIRLDPRHMGRIDVRLSFDHDGVLRAVLSADSASSLDMLRRESTDLNRALADAGVRSDGQSLRFDSRSGGQGGGQRWQGEQQGQQQAGLQSRGGLADGFGGSDDPIYRSLRSSGHVDLMA